MRGKLLVGLLASLVVAVGARADDPLQACLDCHRSSDRSAQIPVIEGQNLEYLRAQMTRFRDRHRDSFPMSALAEGWDDAEVARIAALLAARPWRRADLPLAVPALRDRGAQVASEQECANCHGESFAGAGTVPRTAGQHPGYLARQIAAFGQGNRHHPPTGIGARMHNLDGEEANAVGAWLHAFEPSVSPKLAE